MRVIFGFHGPPLLTFKTDRLHLKTVGSREKWRQRLTSQSRTQSPRAFWPAGERPERLWDDRLHFPRKRGFRSYDVWLSLNGSRKEKTVNSRNGGLKVFEKQEF